MDNWEIALFIAVVAFLVVTFAIVLLVTIKKQYRKGADDLLKLFLETGYNLKVASFKTLNKRAQKGKIVFLGDSLTQDYNIYEFFQGKTVYNRGIGGDTTAGLLKRLETSVFALEPQTVVLLIGTNDLALLHDTLENIAARIATIIEQIKTFNPAIKILLQSLYPVNETIDPLSVNPRKNKDILTLNTKLTTFKEVTYVDLFSSLADEKGRLREEYTFDGLHLNALGYEVVTEIINPLL